MPKFEGCWSLAVDCQGRVNWHQVLRPLDKYPAARSFYYVKWLKSVERFEINASLPINWQGPIILTYLVHSLRLCKLQINYLNIVVDSFVSIVVCSLGRDRTPFCHKSFNALLCEYLLYFG